MEHTQISLTQHHAFMKAVEKEMAKFERQEAEFRKNDRKERVAQLQASTDGYQLAPLRSG